mgnify:CR=1 FL=1
MKNKIIIIAITLIIIIISGTILYSNIRDYLSIIEKKVVYAKVNIGDHIGFDLNSTALTFGMIPSGGSASRDITLQNIHNNSVKIQIYITGYIKDFISASENNFILNDNESKNITFTVAAPKNTPSNSYDGNVIFLMRNPIVK